MRYGWLVVVLVGLAAVMAGCKKPGPQDMSVEQTPPFRTEEELTPEAETDTTTVRPETEDEAEVEIVEVPPTPPGPVTRKYIIQRGDKGFMDIARRILGSEKRWKEIQAMNPGVDSRKLRVGQEILIPAQ
ncbi:MAG TPA: LysM domain-containing protein [Phycisphaerae bacterium]|nr:LysM domain-containing protein [Phycisphaerae bacterium]